LHIELTQEAQLSLREQGVSFALSSHHNATYGNWAFLTCSYTFGMRFLANLHGNGPTHVYKKVWGVLSK